MLTYFTLIFLFSDLSHCKIKMTEIRLEVPSENSVLEIQYDGHELHQP